MIQRIQSIFLLLAAGAFAALISLPFATGTPGPTGIFQDGRYSIHDNGFLMVLTGAGALLSLICIFLFKKRPVQLKVGYLIIVIGILLPVMVVLYYMNQAEHIASTQIQESIGLLMPVVGIVCVVLANIYIRKDERLVKSMDRLR
jgi:hypothetical protein